MTSVNLTHAQNQREIDSLNRRLIELEYPKGTVNLVNDSARVYVLENLLDAYLLKGDYDSAIYCAKISEALAEKLGLIYAAGASAYGLGNAYEELGEFNKAIVYYEKALVLFESLGRSLAKAGVLVSLGNTFLALGNYEKARTYYYAAQKICESENDETGLLSIYGNLGSIQFRQRNYESALEYYQKVLPLAQKFKKKQVIAIAYSNIGAIYSTWNQSDSAIYYFEEAIEIKKDLGDVKSIAITTFNIGALYFVQENYTKALPYYLSAYEIMSSIRAMKWLRVAVMGLFRCQFMLQNYSEAEKYGLEMLNLDKTAIDLNFPLFSEKEKELYLERISLDFQTFCRHGLVLQIHNASITEVVYDKVLYNKGILLKSSAAMKNAVLTSGNNDLISNYEKWIEIKKELVKAYGSGQSIQSLTEKADSIEKILIAQSSSFSDFNQMQSINWKDVKENLGKKEAAVEFVYFPNEYDSATANIYAALIVTPTSEQPLFIRLFEDSELELILGSYPGNDLDYISKVYGTIENPNHQLYDLIWKPIESNLKGMKKVFISPAGLLHKISFDALINKNGYYLSDQYQIQLLSSTAKVAVPSRFELTKAADFLVYGGIEYSSSDSSKKIWTYLPGTKTEAEAVDSILKKNTFQTGYYSGYNATETSFKSGAVKAGIIHIATHGFFYPNPKDQAIQSESSAGNEGKEIKFRAGGLGYATFVQNENPLMRSGLVFAGANDVWTNDSVSGDDGVLTAQEVAHIDMRQTQLVVLSACETGLGDIKGSEGVYGLQRAFKMAGVKYIIMSLWQVPDKETAEFMTLFYQKLIKYKEIHRAFSETQLAMRKKYNPYYWAAFVLLE
jgi:CHAT domain-containing protein/Tfp pilus assembly protein PilF